ncbi:MAG TPA: DNA-formamidopyrimidine glycosylase family protein [Trebonia sp.]|nr:DNA-formamidopyrimidine glycosylase family protein [Trebonia sp.]
MPELPEVESARAVIERKGLRRPIVDVDDSDTYVCRPHVPGEIRHALLGGELITAMRQGKSMWCQVGPSSATVTLGIHLGMSGKIVIADANGTEVDGGDYWEGRRQPGDYRWARFTVTFVDGGRLMLVDPRRLGRIRLNPPVEQLGPDAQLITPAQFRYALAAGGAAPVKARIMDQHRIAGIGNLLADEILWRARIHPARPVGSLTATEESRLLRASRDTIRAALRDGGVHALTIIPHRHRGGRCPRDHAPMRTAAVDGRTSWWCSAEQLLVPGGGIRTLVTPRGWFRVPCGGPQYAVSHSSGHGICQRTRKKDGAVSDAQKGPQFESAPLVTGAALLGAGALIALIGLAVGGGHLVAATRRWVREMEVPPSELARQKWAQARTAVDAGTSAWQNGTKAGAASTS